MMNKLVNIVKHPNKILRQILLHTPNIWPDKLYLKLIYPVYIGEDLDLDNPKSFNAKLQWLKINDRNPKYIDLVDKYKVKDIVGAIIGEEYIIPTIGVWDKPEDIDWDKLPNQFVLKCNHDSGGLFICRDKSKLTESDKHKAIQKLSKSLKRNFFYFGREWPYKKVERKIIAEKYMGESLNDYKFMCFNGKVEYAFVCCGRFSKEGMRKSYYDTNWVKQPFYRLDPPAEEDIDCPKNFEKMIQIAETLSKGMPFARIDFYEVDGKLYFGEITLYPGSGFEPFTPTEWDYKLGDLIKLPKE